MKAYVTKYAVTKGIFVMNGEARGAGLLRVVTTGCMDAYFHRGEWFEDVEQARHDAVKRLTNDIAKKARQLKRLQAMQDDPNWPPVTEG